MICTTCEADRREVWGPCNRSFKLEIVKGGNWINLEQCPKCKALWVVAAYEPYSAFSYLVKWEKTSEEWGKIHSLDAGKTMAHWHASELKKMWGTLPSKEKEAVGFHRNRSYGYYNPIDHPHVEIDIDALLK